MLYIYYNPEYNSQMAVVYIAVGSVIVLRQALVSVKYGFYTKQQWYLMTRTLVTEEFILNSLILVIWVKVPENIAQKEINISLRKSIFNPEKIELKFNNVPAIFLEDNNEHLNPEGNTLGLVKLASYLIKEVSNAQETKELSLISRFSLFYILSFVLLRYLTFSDKSSEVNPFEIVYMIVSIYKAFISSKQFVTFIYTGVYDFRRRIMLMAQCSAIISNVDQKLLYFKEIDKPQLDFNDPTTILAWYLLRRAFLDFGKRYTLRVFLYASLIFPLCIGSVIIVLLQTNKVIGIEYNYYLIPSALLTVMVFIVLIQMSFAALSLNNAFSVHRDLLLECYSNLKNNQDANKDALKALLYVIARLKHDELVRPVHILGLKINNNFILKLILALISGIALVFQLYLKFS